MKTLGLVRFSALGDILLTEPVARLQKRADPGIRIVYLTKAQFASVPEGWPDIDQVIPLGPGESISSLRDRMKAAGVEQLVDLHANLRSRLLAPLSNRLPKHRLDKMLLVHARRLGHLLPDPGPVWQRYLRLLDLPCDDPEFCRPRLVVGGRRLGHGAACHISLVPGAGRATKTWPAEHWVEFLRLLLDRRSDSVVILGGAKERDLGLRLQRMNPARVSHHCGTASLAESARLVADSAAIVCGDTGLMHMADAAGVPGVMLAGSSHRRLGFYPSGASLRVLERDLPCRPCSHVGREVCPLKHFACMLELEPTQVFAHLEEVLG